MKKAIRRFLWDLLVKTVNNFDDPTYDKFLWAIHRPEFARRRPLPVASGGQIQFFNYKTLVRKPDIDHCPKCGGYLHDEMGHICP